MLAELDALDQGPGEPAAAARGRGRGAKVSTKIDLLDNHVAKVDFLLIGGGMANTFLHAIGIGIGRSLAERDLANDSPAHLRPGARDELRIILPVDAVVAERFEAGAPHHTYGIDAIPENGMILDIGSQSVDRVNSALNDAATLLFNGPLGAFEHAPFDQGTVAVARHAAERTRAGKLVSVAGRRVGGGAQPRGGGGDSPTCPRRAAPSWNGWKARRCRGLRR